MDFAPFLPDFVFFSLWMFFSNSISTKVLLYSNFFLTHQVFCRFSFSMFVIESELFLTVRFLKLAFVFLRFHPHFLLAGACVMLFFSSLFSQSMVREQCTTSMGWSRPEFPQTKLLFAHQQMWKVTAFNGSSTLILWVFSVRLVIWSKISSFPVGLWK